MVLFVGSDMCSVDDARKVSVSVFSLMEALNAAGSLLAFAEFGYIRCAAVVERECVIINGHHFFHAQAAETLRRSGRARYQRTRLCSCVTT